MACTFDMEGVKRLTLKEREKERVALGETRHLPASDSALQDLRNKGLDSSTIISSFWHHIITQVIRKVVQSRVIFMKEISGLGLIS